MTESRHYELRVDMAKFDNTTAYAVYDDFRVAAAVENYTLASLGLYMGTAGELVLYYTTP